MSLHRPDFLHRLPLLRRQRRCAGTGQQRCRPARSRGLLGQVGLLPLVTVLAVTAGTLTRRPIAGAGVGVLLLVVMVVRRGRRVAPIPGPGGPRGGGPGGTAGVREPRRPHPSPPAGALALPEPAMRDDEVAALA